MKWKALLEKLFKRKEEFDHDNLSEGIVPKTEDAFINFAISHFRSEGIKLAAGATDDNIFIAENQLNFIFPDDFKEFHLVFDGFKDWEMDSNNFSIWNIKRIIEEYEKEKTEDSIFIPIGDYLINSHWYGYIRGKEGIFKDYDRSKAIAQDFKALIQLILEDSNLLY